MGWAARPLRWDPLIVVPPLGVMGSWLVVAAWFGSVRIPQAKAGAEDEVRRALSLEADTRAEAVDIWLDGRLDELRYAAAALQDHDPFSDVPDPGVLRHVRAFSGSDELERVILLSAALHPTVGSREPPSIAEADRLLADSVRRGAAAPVAVRRRDGRTILLFVVPVGHEADAAVLIGEAPVSQWLAPFMNRPPATYASSEATLAVAEGDSAVFFTPLRFATGPAWLVRRPLADPGMTAATGVKPSAPVSGSSDYRGVPVYAARRRLVNAPWGLNLKVDVEDVLGPVRRLLLVEAVITSGVVFMLAGFATTLGGAVLGRRRRSAARLDESEDRYRRIVETAHEGIALVDAEWRIGFASGRAMELVGLSADAVVGRRLLELIQTDQDEVTARLLRGAGDRLDRLVVRAGPGGGRMVQLSTSPRLDSEGRFTGAVVMLADVTDRHRAEALFTAVVRESPIPIAVIDRDLRVTLWNPACERTFGWSAAEAVGSPPPHLGAAELAEYRRLCNRALAGESLSYQSRRARRDGRMLDITVSMSPLHDPSGYVTAVLVMLVDTTESREAREALAATEAKFRGLFEAAGLGVALGDLEGRALAVNPALARILGRPAADLVGQHFASVTHPDDLASEDPLFAEVARGRRPFYQTRKRVVRPDGSIRWVSATVSGIPSTASAEPGMTAVIVEDITELMRSRVALERLQLAVEQSPAPVVITDVSGTIEYVNPRFTELTGYSAAEAVGRNPRFLQSGRTPPEVYDSLWRTIMDGWTWEGELLNRKKSGELFWEKVSISPVRDSTGQIVHFVAVKQDITAGKARDRELVALTAIGGALDPVTTRDEVMTLALAQVVPQLDGDCGCVIIQDPAGRFTVRAATGPWAYGIGRPCLDGGPAVELHRGGLPGITTRPPAGLGRAGPGDGGSWTALGMPLWAAGTVVGSVWVGRQLTGGEARSFTPWDVRLAAAIAPIIEVAYRRAGLQEETSHRLQRLLTMKSIDSAIAASLDLRVTLQLLLEHVATQLKVDACSIVLQREPGGDFVFADGHGLRARGGLRLPVRPGAGAAGRAILEREVQLSQPALEAPGDPRAEALAQEGFVAQVAAPLISRGQVIGVLELLLRQPLEHDLEWDDYLASLADQAAIAIDKARLVDDLQRSNDELELAYDATIEGWVRALDLRDQETEGHTQRVTELTLTLARRFNFTDETLVHIRRGALLHDIGKVGVPDAILRKPGSLTDAERTEIRRHTVYAYDMLAPIPYLRPALEIPYCHHEHWDGRGYPRGLAGEAIPLAARLFAVADRWDALTSDRVYRKAWPRAEAVAHLRSIAGSELDPAIVPVFLDMIAQP